MFDLGLKMVVGVFMPDFVLHAVVEPRRFAIYGCEFGFRFSSLHGNGAAFGFKLEEAESGVRSAKYDIFAPLHSLASGGTKRNLTSCRVTLKFRE